MQFKHFLSIYLGKIGITICTLQRMQVMQHVVIQKTLVFLQHITYFGFHLSSLGKKCSFNFLYSLYLINFRKTISISTIR